MDKLGRYEEAIDSYDQALSIKPDFQEAWNNRGNELSKLGRYEEAINSYDRALQIDSNEYGIWNNRGIVLGDLGRYEESLTCYDRALQIKPDFELAIRNRSKAKRKLLVQKITQDIKNFINKVFAR